MKGLFMKGLFVIFMLLIIGCSKPLDIACGTDNDCNSKQWCYNGLCVDKVCTDSDNGQDPFTSGITKGKLEGKWTARPDSCEGKSVTEYFCEGDTIKSINIPCERYCTQPIQGAYCSSSWCNGPVGFDCIDNPLVKVKEYQIALRNQMGMSVEINGVESSTCKYVYMAVGNAEIYDAMGKTVPEGSVFRLKFSECSFSNGQIEDNSIIDFDKSGEIIRLPLSVGFRV